MALSLDGTTGISASGNITGGNVIASGSLVVGSFAPASVSTAGNIVGANITTVGLISATGNITSAGNIAGGNLLTGGLISAAGTITTGGDHSLTGNIVDTGALSIITGSNGNIAFLPNGTGIVTASGAVSAVGNITGGNLITGGTLSVTGNIVSTGSNGVANIGSATTYFNTVHAKATSAQYADLAEMYQGDESYMPGTVIEFGGTHEVTITTELSSTCIAGVVSTNPSYLMNSGLTNLNSVPVALTGRVPCRVLGPVRKGDRLVSSIIPGVAQALDEETYKPGCIIGKSLEDWPESTVKLIEVVVGRV